MTASASAKKKEKNTEGMSACKIFIDIWIDEIVMLLHTQNMQILENLVCILKRINMRNE